MKFHGDYHTHTYFSDGVSKVEENVKSAFEKGLKQIAITDHGYGNPPRFSLTPEKFLRQRRLIEEARLLYPDVEVLHGVEADIVSLDGDIDLTSEQMRDMDILVMGYHSFSQARSRRDWRRMFLPSFFSFAITPPKYIIKGNTQAMIKAIKRHPIDILAHVNHLCKVDCVEVAKACADYGTLMELNVKHVGLSHRIFDKILETDVNFVINSDAHHFSKVGEFTPVIEYLSRHSFSYDRIVNLENAPVFPRKDDRQK